MAGMDEDACSLIPAEVIHRYLRAVVDALDALRAGRRESGRAILRRGLHAAPLVFQATLEEFEKDRDALRNP